ncbi:MAG: hypothetical protein GWQ05_20965 [Verrucomicrobiaceae bacterium]|nr:hypothetical protein [Verrucomicrobiaceae bacterium]
MFLVSWPPRIVSAQEDVVEPIWTLSQAPGIVQEAFDLRANYNLTGATVHYTIDGSAPSLDSPLWSGRYRAEATIMLRWIAVVDEVIVARKGAGYLFADAGVADFSSDLPIVVVDSFGVDIDSEGLADSRGPKRPVWSVFFERDPSTGRASPRGTVDFSGRAGMRVRGQSSTMFPKKQYTLELWDEENDDQSASLLGFPRESDWILHAPFSDKTLMRNVLAYAWFREMGHYAVKTQYVELFYNRDGDSVSLQDYVGVYVLMEKIKRDSERVAITKLDETVSELPELSGGYIFKKDKGTQNDVNFRTPDGHRFGFVEPDEPTELQFHYLDGHLAEFEHALYSRDFKDPDKGYAAYIDVDSFIDVHLHVEICRNIDGIRLSTYYHKDREGKINMGPVWDYNLSLGNTTMREGQYPDGWYHHTIHDREYTYFARLFEDPGFELLYWDRYYQLRKTMFSRARLAEQIKELTRELSESQERNFRKWQILGMPVWQNPRGVWKRQSHQAEVEWMKRWLFQRLEWMDGQFIPPPVIKASATPLPPGGTVFLNLPSLGPRLRNPQLVYTMDGSDPRGADNRPSATAASVAPGTAVELATTSTVCVRALDRSRWGALEEIEVVVDASLPAMEPNSQRSWSYWLMVLIIGVALLMGIGWKRVRSL